MKERFKRQLKFDTHTLAAMSVMIALTCVSTYLPAIQISGDLAVTYQSFFAVLNGLLLGAVWGAVAQFIYVVMGLVGLPVFSQGGSGLGYVLRPSFGYLIGFIFGAFVAGLIMDCFRTTAPWKAAVAGICGTLVIYPFGVSYMVMALTVFNGIPLAVATASLVTIPFFLLGDLICLILIVLLPLKTLRRLTLDHDGRRKASVLKKRVQPNENYGKEVEEIAVTEERLAIGETPIVSQDFDIETCTDTDASDSSDRKTVTYLDPQ